MNVSNEATIRIPKDEYIYTKSIRNRLKHLVEDIMGYEVIDEQASPNVGANKVRIYFERDSDEGLHEYRGYYVIVFYIDRKLTDSQREARARGFYQEFKDTLYFNRNNIYAVQKISFVGTMFIDMKVKNLEGFKILYGITSKG
jgi:hypothetical protein